MVTLILTGHMHVGSAIESSSDCGNCDGARCAHCKTVWEFEGKRYNSIEAVVEAVTQSSTSWEELVPGVEKPSHPQFTLNSDGELCALCWSWEKADHLVICDPSASVYDALYAKALEATAFWVKCPCSDKTEHCFANDCSIMGCNDSRCRFDVEHRGRTERKWYM